VQHTPASLAFEYDSPAKHTLRANENKLDVVDIIVLEVTDVIESDWLYDLKKACERCERREIGYLGGARGLKNCFQLTSSQ
jgi:hypothetical protein